MVEIKSVVFSPDVLRAISGDNDHKVKVRSVAVEDSVDSLYAVVGSSVLTVLTDKTANIWSSTTGDNLVVFSPDGLRNIFGGAMTAKSRSGALPARFP